MRRSIISTFFGLIGVSSIQLFSASAANAQFYYSMDTGVVFLAPGQTLRVSASGTGSETVTVKFKKMEYVESGITDGVLRQQVASQSTTGSLPLAGDQALVFNAVASGAGVRVQLHSSSPNVNVIASVITPGIGGTAASEQVYLAIKLENTR